MRILLKWAFTLIVRFVSSVSAVPHFRSASVLILCRCRFKSFLQTQSNQNNRNSKQRPRSLHGVFLLRQAGCLLALLETFRARGAIWAKGWVGVQRPLIAFELWGRPRICCKTIALFWVSEPMRHQPCHGHVSHIVGIGFIAAHLWALPRVH